MGAFDATVVVLITLARPSDQKASNAVAAAAEATKLSIEALRTVGAALIRSELPLIVHVKLSIGELRP